MPVKLAVGNTHETKVSSDVGFALQGLLLGTCPYHGSSVQQQFRAGVFGFTAVVWTKR